MGQVLYVSRFLRFIRRGAIVLKLKLSLGGRRRGGGASCANRSTTGRSTAVGRRHDPLCRLLGSNDNAAVGCDLSVEEMAIIHPKSMSLEIIWTNFRNHVRVFLSQFLLLRLECQVSIWGVLTVVCALECVFPGTHFCIVWMGI